MKLLMEFVSHLDKKLLLPKLFDVTLYELDLQDSQKKITAEDT